MMNLSTMPRSLLRLYLRPLTVDMKFHFSRVRKALYTCCIIGNLFLVDKP